MPFTIRFRAYRTIPHHILVSQLSPDHNSGICQIVDVVDGEHPASGFLGDFTEEGRTDLLFEGAEIAIIDTDGIHERVSFSCQRFDFMFTIATVIITTIGNDQQCLSRIPRLSHFREPEINGVKQGGTASRSCREQPVLNLVA